MMLHNLLRKKDILSIPNELGKGNHEGKKLKKILSVRDLTLMGIAAVIGAGIFSTVGNASSSAGPGVIILFVLASMTCAFSALCYAEFASYIPLSGSAYTYAYFTFGEVIAWIVGWALILEYAISNSALAISWSSYFQNLLLGLDIQVPAWLVSNYEKADATTIASAPKLFGIPILMNIPAFLFNIFITALAYIGIKESKKVTNITVMYKIGLLVFIIILGFFYVTPSNWTPFLPNGMAGVFGGVSAVFFAFIGFDAISTTAEECRNPQKDLPTSMIYSLLICTVIYILISLVLTGIVPYHKLGIADPIAFVFEYIHLDAVSYFISVSALVVIFSAFIVFQLAQPRIWMSMGRDGLLPKKFSYIHPKYKTPTFATIVTGIVVGIPAAFLDLSIVTDLTSVGTLFAFFVVCVGVLYISQKRRKDPNFPKAKYQIPYINSKWIFSPIAIIFLIFNWGIFKQSLIHLDLHIIPYIIFLIVIFVMIVLTFIQSLSLIPVMGSISCLFLITLLGWKNWLLFFIWIAVGLIIYFIYGYKKSKLNVRKA